MRDYSSIQTSPALLGQDEQFSDEFSFSVATATDSSKKEPSSSVATLQVFHMLLISIFKNFYFNRTASGRRRLDLEDVYYVMCSMM